jgi:predicted nucleotidyltransferase
MVDKNVVTKAVKERLQALYGDRLAKVILYGSYARGDFHDESDIDFLVVLKDKEIQMTKELDFMCEPLLRLSLDFGVAISNFPTTLNKLKSSDFLFYKQVRTEGVEV